MKKIAALLLSACMAVNSFAQLPVSAGSFRAGAGSSGAPSFTFTGQTDTGIYSIGSGSLGIVAGGTNQSLALTSSGTGTINFGTSFKFHTQRYIAPGSVGLVVEGTGFSGYDSTSSPTPQAHIILGTTGGWATYALYDLGAPSGFTGWEMDMTGGDGALHFRGGDNLGAANGVRMTLAKEGNITLLTSTAATSISLGATPATISSTAGALSLSSGGSDKDLTLTPSGTGAVSVGLPSGATVDTVAFRVAGSVSNAATIASRTQNNSTAGTAGTEVVNGNGNGAQFFARGSGQSSYGAIPSGQSFGYYSSSAFPHIFMADNASGYFAWATGGNSERVRINTAGEVQIGSTTDLGAFALQVTGNATITGNIAPSNTAAIWRAGTGSPEGVVTAVVGSMFTRTDGGASTTLYIKESGSGNTGWVAK